MSIMFVYVTTADSGEATRIARAIVEQRLAACANIIDGMRSVYWWQGALQEASETVLILKTVKERLGVLMAAVKALHSYDCPCIEAIEVADGDPEFFAWVRRETQEGMGGEG